MAARRQIALKFRDNAPSAANFARLFGVESAPHGDTLDYAFKNIKPQQVQECVTRLVEILIRKKVLERYRLLDQYYVIAFDGTGIYSFSDRHCEHCLTRTHNGKPTYYHYVLEAKLVTWDGFSFSLMSEFIKNPQANPTKQDCELNAFHRLAARLKKRFPRLPICLSLDGLFACGPVFLRCRAYNWRFMIVLKEDGLQSVYNEFVGLSKLQPEGQMKERILKPVEIKRNFRWVHGIGNFAQVPLIIGTTGDDLAADYPPDRTRPLDFFGADAERARRLYDPEGVLPVDKLAFRIAIDMTMHEPARFVARKMTAAGKPAWLYRFDYVTDSLRPKVASAAHAGELSYLFDQMDARYSAGLTSRDRAMAKTFHQYFVNFAKTGDPNGAGLPPWPKFEPSKFDLMLFNMDGEAKMQPDPWRERLALVEREMDARAGS